MSITYYTITRNMDDNTLIDRSSVEEGVEPVHQDPVKPETPQYICESIGWSPKIAAAADNAVYTARFRPS